METINLTNFCGITNKYNLNRTTIIQSQSDNRFYLARLIALFRNWEFTGELKNFHDFTSKYEIFSWLTKNTYIEYQSDERIITFNGEIFNCISKLTKTDETIRQEKILQKQFATILNDSLIVGSQSAKHQYLYNHLSFLQISAEHIFILPVHRISVCAFSDIFAKYNGRTLPSPFIIYDFEQRFSALLKERQNLNFPDWDITYECDNKINFITNVNRKTKLSECEMHLQSIFPVLLFLSGNNKLFNYNLSTCIIEEPDLLLNTSQIQKLEEFINFNQFIFKSLLITINNSSEFSKNTKSDILKICL